jgi:hypothetical protein
MSPLILSDAVFSGNSRAMVIGADATINNCIISGCTSLAVQADSGSVTISDCEFRGNQDQVFDISEPCSVVVRRSVFAQNTPNGVSVIDVSGDFDGAGGTYFELDSCRVDSNDVEDNPVLHVVSTDLRIINCAFRENTATNAAGCLSIRSSGGLSCRAVIDSSDFLNNSIEGVGVGGGSVIDVGYSSAEPIEFYLGHSTISGNLCTAAAIHGDSVITAGGYSCLMERTLFYDNQSSGGGASAVSLGNPYDGPVLELRNLTVMANSGPGAAVKLDVPAILRNSIVSANSSVSQISGSSPEVIYCITSDDEYHGPNGSFDADPLFEDYPERDLRLSAGSPAINRGDPNSLYNDPDGSRADIGAVPSESFSPVIESVLDIPQDNGRQVMVQWLPSAGDDNRAGILSYQIFREVNLPIVENYELVAEIPASQLPGYGQIVTTIADSNQLGQPYFTFFVRAMSINPLAFWDSDADSGYSVDNLAPQAPALLAELVTDDIALNWTAVADSDLAYYEIYRADQPFDPDSVAVYTTTTDTFFTDFDLTGDAYAYRVRAVDYNGNLSDASNEQWIVLQTLPAPIYFTVLYESGFMVMRWLPVSGAMHYSIYAADSADEPGSLLVTTTNTSHITPLNDAFKLYWVTAEP